MSALDFRLTGVGTGATRHEQLRSSCSRRSLTLRKTAAKTGLSRMTIAAVECGGGTIASLLPLVTLLAPGVRRGARERPYRGAGDKRDRYSRFTPADPMDRFYAAFGDVDPDPCASAQPGGRVPTHLRRRRWRRPFGRVVGTSRVRQPAVLGTERLAYPAPTTSGRPAGSRRSAASCPAEPMTLFHEKLSADPPIFLLRGRVRLLDPQGGSQPTPVSLIVLALGSTVERRKTSAKLTAGTWLAFGGDGTGWR